MGIADSQQLCFRRRTVGTVNLRLQNPPSFSMILRSRALLLSVFGFSFLAFAGYGIGFWTPPFFFRVHGVSPAEAGTVLGLTAALSGWAGGGVPPYSCTRTFG